MEEKKIHWLNQFFHFFDRNFFRKSKVFLQKNFQQLSHYLEAKDGRSIHFKILINKSFSLQNNFFAQKVNWVGTIALVYHFSRVQTESEKTFFSKIFQNFWSLFTEEKILDTLEEGF